MFIIWYSMNKTIEIKIGIPNPPFLIIDPKDDPIINKIIQANAKENFLCHSILCLFITEMSIF